MEEPPDPPWPKITYKQIYRHGTLESSDPPWPRLTIIPLSQGQTFHNPTESYTIQPAENDKKVKPFWTPLSNEWSQWMPWRTLSSDSDTLKTSCFTVKATPFLNNEHIDASVKDWYYSMTQLSSMISDFQQFSVIVKPQIMSKGPAKWQQSTAKKRKKRLNNEECSITSKSEESTALQPTEDEIRCNKKRKLARKPSNNKDSLLLSKAPQDTTTIADKKEIEHKKQEEYFSKRKDVFSMLANVTKMKQEKRKQKKKKTQPTAKPDEGKGENKDKSPPKALKKKKPEAAKSYKFRIYPKPAQHIKLKQWLGIVRWTYNSCVAYINQWKPRYLTKDNLRVLFVGAETAFDEEMLKKVIPEDKVAKQMALKPYILAVPADIRDSAISDIIKAFKLEKKKCEEQGKPLPNFKFRKLKDKHASFVMPNKHWKRKKGEYAQVLSKAALDLKDQKRSEKNKQWNQFPEDLVYDSRLVKTKDHKYYLCVPKPLEIQRESQALIKEHIFGSNTQVIAIDPGTRTFSTGYDLSKGIFEWGVNDKRRFIRLCKYLDDLKSRMAKMTVDNFQYSTKKRQPKSVRRKGYRTGTPVEHYQLNLAKIETKREKRKIKRTKIEQMREANISSSSLSSSPRLTTLVASHHLL